MHYKKRAKARATPSSCIYYISYRVIEEENAERVTTVLENLHILSD